MSKKSPQLRFEGFTDDWEERKLGEITTSYSGGTPSAGNSSYYKGDIPFIRSGEINSSKTELFLTEEGFNNSSAKLVEVGDILYALYGATSGEVGISQINGAINQAILAIKPIEGYESQFIMQWLKLQKQKIIGKYLQGGQGNLSGTIVKDLFLRIPDSKEQKKIGQFFKQLDDTIALHQRKLDLLKEQKKGYLQKMFPKNGAKVPELRFAGFADDWEERKLSSGLREYTDRVIVEDDKEYYQISVRNNFGGITLRGSKIGNKIGRKRQAKINLTKYPQTLIFTRQTVEQGGIGWVDKYCDGAIVTENMPTISLDTSVFSKYFLTNLFQTRIFYKNAILDNIEGGSAQIAIHESKFLSSILLFPNLDEQEKIGQFFKQLDNTIALHQRKIDLLKEQKKGYLQKMFPKNGAKVPELRFEGFADDWEQRKLGEFSDVRDGTHASPKYVSQGHPMVTSKNLTHSGLDMTDVSFLTDEDFNEINKRSKVSIGDILFGMIGTIGNPVIVDRDDFAIKNVALIKEKTSNPITNKWLLQYLKSPSFNRFIQKENAGGTQKFIALGLIRDMKLRVPEFDEQQKIGAFFKKIDDTIALHQRKLDLLKEQKKGFLQKMFV